MDQLTRSRFVEASQIVLLGEQPISEADGEMPTSVTQNFPRRELCGLEALFGRFDVSGNLCLERFQ